MNLSSLSTNQAISIASLKTKVHNEVIKYSDDLQSFTSKNTLRHENEAKKAITSFLLHVNRIVRPLP